MLVTGVNLAGIQRTARTTRLLVVAVTAVLAAAVVAGLAGAGPGGREALSTVVDAGDVLATAALLFFAFAATRG